MLFLENLNAVTASIQVHPSTCPSVLVNLVTIHLPTVHPPRIIPHTNPSMYHPYRSSKTIHLDIEAAKLSNPVNAYLTIRDTTNIPSFAG